MVTSPRRCFARSAAARRATERDERGQRADAEERDHEHSSARAGIVCSIADADQLDLAEPVERAARMPSGTPTITALATAHRDQDQVLQRQRAELAASCPAAPSRVAAARPRKRAATCGARSARPGPPSRSGRAIAPPVEPADHRALQRRARLRG